MYIARTVSICLKCIVGITMFVMPVSAQTPGQPPLFFELPSFDQMPAEMVFAIDNDKKLKAGDPTILRSRVVRLDVKTLGSNVMDIKPASSSAPTVRLNLFKDLNFFLVADEIRKVSNSLTQVQGHDAEIKESGATLIVRDGQITGNIWMGERLIQIRPTINGLQSITEVNQSGFGEELEPTAPDLEQNQQDRSEQDVDPSSTPVIDIAVFYTPATETASVDIQAEILLAEAETNKSYENSNVKQRIRIVHMGSIAYDESWDLFKDRNRIRTPGDGYMDGVHSIRDTVAADLVSLWVENSNGGACGVAYIMEEVSPDFESYGFSVVKRSCATGYFSFGHELGHNMGARHDHRVDPTTGKPYDHNHGYTLPPKRWRTIMGYNTACGAANPCTRIPYWSNPDVSYRGDPTGTRSSVNEKSDNSLTLDKTANVIAKFR